MNENMYEKILEAMNDTNNWFPTHKTSYNVSVKLPQSGTEVQNYLENANYVTDENKAFVIRGTVGETWVIDEKKLGKTYIFADGTPFSQDEFMKRANAEPDTYQTLTTIQGDNSVTNFAFHLPDDITNFPVKTSWGDTLYANNPDVVHNGGDYLVVSIGGGGLPNLDDMWVVNSMVFETTYDLNQYVEPQYGEEVEREEESLETDEENVEL